MLQIHLLRFKFFFPISNSSSSLPSPPSDKFRCTQKKTLKNTKQTMIIKKNDEFLQKNTLLPVLANKQTKTKIEKKLHRWIHSQFTRTSTRRMIKSEKWRKNRHISQHRFTPKKNFSLYFKKIKMKIKLPSPPPVFVSAKKLKFSWNPNSWFLLAHFQELLQTWLL